MSRSLRIVALSSAALLASATGRTARGIEWTDGDYGPVVSTHMDAGGRNFGDKKVLDEQDLANYVFRGRLISLDDDRRINLCFDTEHMRVAAAWAGGYVDWKGAFKNQGPGIRGEVVFNTRPGPGWSRDGRWDDPRDPKEGPLPADWAKYRGLHLHGRRVVLAYTVGAVDVLEMPAARRVGKGDAAAVAFARHLTLGPSKQPLEMLIAQGKPLATAGVNLPDGATIVRIEDRTILRIPPLSKRTSFAVEVAAQGADLSKSPVEAIDLGTLTKGGPRRWNETVETRGTRGKDDAAYVVDEITAPMENPWKSWIRFGALDFFPDGRAALSTWDGDVWIASGLDDGLERVRWTRFATGLHQPLGLKIVKGLVYTAGRDQVTRLHDLNGDGEADWYENFNNDAGLTPQRHEYVLDLQTDAEGNLYYCRSGHYVPSQRGENCCVMKLPPDGSKLEIVARGLREPNGMSIGPDGLMTVGDNEGNGIPQTPIYALRQGRFFGFTGALRKGERSKLGPWAKPIVWLPKTVDQSAGSQVWVEGNRWGPLKGHLLHTSYGHCKLFHILLDRNNDVLQGAAWEFPLRFRSGVMRGRFRKRDGQLYLCGLRGWGTSAAADTQFCRVRYTGRTPRLPLAFRATADGVAITFATKLDARAAVDDQNWAVEVASTKGKPVELFVDELDLSADGKTVTLVLEESEPTEMMTIEYRIRDAGGDALTGKLHATINVVPKR